MQLPGKIVSHNIIKLKFSMSGTIRSVSASPGKSVKKGELLATIDKKELQAYLDRALKYYESERAEFDVKQKKEMGGYEKVKSQNSLDISVKNVEIAKSNLEATNLYAPIDGIVSEMDPIVPGVNISPSNFVITIINPSSFYFEAIVKEEDLEEIGIDDYAEITLTAFKDKKFKGRISSIGLMPSGNGKYPVIIVLENTDNLRLGLNGEAGIRK